ncbi:MAG: type II toxin-antitoxin system VapC family toxin [Cyanobacteria bacterium]|nr:type II toxin-antitoxin system VapC family toxin [Cyanobacteriota bacterium]
MIQFDSSYLIDLQLELRNERPGSAFKLIESLDASELLAVSVHVAAELRVGAERRENPIAAHRELDAFLEAFLILYPDHRFAAAYARLWAAANHKRRIVPSMDLLIATAAVVENAPLVTRNVTDFSRLPGLRVLGY